MIHGRCRPDGASNGLDVYDLIYDQTQRPSQIHSQRPSQIPSRRLLAKTLAKTIDDTFAKTYANNSKRLSRNPSQRLSQTAVQIPPQTHSRKPSHTPTQRPSQRSMSFRTRNVVPCVFVFVAGVGVGVGGGWGGVNGCGYSCYSQVFFNIYIYMYICIYGCFRIASISGVWPRMVRISMVPPAPSHKLLHLLPLCIPPIRLLYLIVAEMMLFRTISFCGPKTAVAMHHCRLSLPMARVVDDLTQLVHLARLLG